jgi:hypothetical protein
MKVYVVEEWETKDMYIECIMDYHIYSSEEAARKNWVLDEDFEYAMRTKGHCFFLEVVDIGEVQCTF